MFAGDSKDNPMVDTFVSQSFVVPMKKPKNTPMAKEKIVMYQVRTWLCLDERSILWKFTQRWCQPNQAKKKRLCMEKVGMVPGVYSSHRYKKE